MLVDVHAHLDDEAFKGDIELVIKRAVEGGITAIINNGTNPVSNRRTLELAALFPVVKPALGLFPADAVKMSEEEINKELFFIVKQEPIALGEVGLDLHHLKELDKQKEVFIKFIKLSKEINIPLIVHSRNAEEEVIQTLEDEGAKKVLLHCFGGNKKLIERCEKNGWFFSIPTNITRSQHFQNLVEQVSITKLLTETDSPLLSSEKNKRNEPIFIKKTIKKIAEIKNLEESEVEKNIYVNFQNFFSKN